MDLDTDWCALQASCCDVICIASAVAGVAYDIVHTWYHLLSFKLDNVAGGGIYRLTSFGSCVISYTRQQLRVLCVLCTWYIIPSRVYYSCTRYYHIRDQASYILFVVKGFRLFVAFHARSPIMHRFVIFRRFLFSWSYHGGKNVKTETYISIYIHMCIPGMHDTYQVPGTMLSSGGRLWYSAKMSILRRWVLRKKFLKTHLRKIPSSTTRG